MKTNEQKRLLMIVSFITSVMLMFLVIDQYGQSGSSQNEYDTTRQTTDGYGESTKEIRKQAGPIQSPNDAPWVHSKQTGERTIMTFLNRRMYPGAPPVIPHEVDENSLNESECQSCHEEGGYTEEFDAFAPVTPHRNNEMQNCRQCHQPRKTEHQFRDTDWKTVTPPGNKRTGLSSAPPKIPHDLQYRSFCLSCHAGPGSVKSLQTDHPERSNCLQCHQPRNTKGQWKRNQRNDEQ